MHGHCSPPSQTCYAPHTDPTFPPITNCSVGNSKPPIARRSTQVNQVSGQMGVFLSGTVTNPGTSLNIQTPSEVSNAELAAQRYVNYLRGTVVLSPNALNSLVITIEKARATVPRGTPGSQQFYSLLATADRLAATRPALPPINLRPPPPPPRTFKPPASPPPPGRCRTTALQCTTVLSLLT